VLIEDDSNKLLEDTMTDEVSLVNDKVLLVNDKVSLVKDKVSLVDSVISLVVDEDPKLLLLINDEVSIELDDIEELTVSDISILVLVTSNVLVGTKIIP
jgi:hypothetical protein